MKSITEIYDKAYADKYRVLAETELGKRIYAERWKLIEKYCHGEMTLLDFGCGPGAFHQSGTNGFKTMGYDVNPECGFSHFPTNKVEIMTMWDSIEHLTEPFWPINFYKPKWLFISTPNLDSVKNFMAWKHRRPGEHLWYFTFASLDKLLDNIGYEVLEYNFDEGGLRDPECPEAIITVVARRRDQ